jgi:hypothetical protein
LVQFAKHHGGRLPSDWTVFTAWMKTNDFALSDPVIPYPNKAYSRAWLSNGYSLAWGSAVDRSSQQDRLFVILYPGRSRYETNWTAELRRLMETH